MPRAENQCPLGNALESVRLSLPTMTLNQDSARMAPRIAAWVVFVITLSVVVFARIRLLGLPLERDEGEYAYTGQLILHGVPPYRLAYSMKFPGTAGVYALLMLVFGQSTTGIHI